MNSLRVKEPTCLIKNSSTQTLKGKANESQKHWKKGRESQGIAWGGTEGQTHQTHRLPIQALPSPEWHALSATS